MQRLTNLLLSVILLVLSVLAADSLGLVGETVRASNVPQWEYLQITESLSCGVVMVNHSIIAFDHENPIHSSIGLNLSQDEADQLKDCEIENSRALSEGNTLPYQPNKITVLSDLLDGLGEQGWQWMNPYASHLPAGELAGRFANYFFIRPLNP